MYKRWFTIVVAILILFGVVYSTIGLKVLPIVSKQNLLQWESCLYGAIMLGWGVTLLLVGGIAFDKNDNKLKRALLVGLFS